MDSDPLSIVSTTPAAAADPKAPLGYTPPLDVRKTDSAAEERTGDPLTHRLFAGRAGEVIETPGFGGETVTGGTFTRVNPANILANRKKAAAAGRVTDTPIPDPATYWLLLSALPALLVARRRLPGRSLP